MPTYITIRAHRRSLIRFAGGEILDVGVIGVGMMGRNHARVYSELKAVDSLYLYDLNGKAASDLAGAFGATASPPTVEDLLRSVDAVSVCVPTPYHFSVAETVLDAGGVPVLIEKPICATAEETRRLIAMISDGLIVGVGHIERFNPIVPEIKKIVRRPPLYIEMKRHNPASSRVSGSSVVEDLMIHDVDIVRNVLLPDGPPINSPAVGTRTFAAPSSLSEEPRYTSRRAGSLQRRSG